MDILDEIMQDREKEKSEMTTQEQPVPDSQDKSPENTEPKNTEPGSHDSTEFNNGQEPEVPAEKTETKDDSTNTPEERTEEDIAKEIMSDKVSKEEYNKLREELDELKKKNAEYSKGVSQRKNVFANDKIKSFNRFVSKSGIEDYNVFNAVTGANVDEMSDVQALVLAEIIETPELSSQRRELEEDFNEEYLIDIDDDEVTESQKGKALRKLKRDAVKAKERIRGLHEKLKTDDEPEEDTDFVDPEEKEAERLSTWNPLIAEMATEKYFKTIPVDTEIDGKKKTLAAYDVTKEDLNFVDTFLKDYTSRPGFEANADNVKEAYRSAMKELYIARTPKITKIMYDNIRSEVEKEYREKYAGGKAINSDKSQSVGASKTKREIALEEMLNS